MNLSAMTLSALRESAATSVKRSQNLTQDGLTCCFSSCPALNSAFSGSRCSSFPQLDTVSNHSTREAGVSQLLEVVLHIRGFVSFVVFGRQCPCSLAEDTPLKVVSSV
jgi:hypothetical protein